MDIKSVSMNKISPNIINFLTTSMKEWKTNLYLNAKNKLEAINTLAISNIQLQCSQLESRRHEENRLKNPKIDDLKQNASPRGRCE